MANSYLPNIQRRTWLNLNGIHGFCLVNGVCPSIFTALKVFFSRAQCLGKRFDLDNLRQRVWRCLSKCSIGKRVNKMVTLSNGLSNAVGESEVRERFPVKTTSVWLELALVYFRKRRVYMANGSITELLWVA